MTTLYHPQIGFPSTFRRPVGSFRAVASAHAKDRAELKGFKLPTAINLNDYSIVEIEMDGSRLVKIVVRGEYDSYDDICMAIMFKNGGAFIKTAWLNAWDDSHKTLDPSRYGRP